MKSNSFTFLDAQFLICGMKRSYNIISNFPFTKECPVSSSGDWYEALSLMLEGVHRYKTSHQKNSKIKWGVIYNCKSHTHWSDP